MTRIGLLLLALCPALPVHAADAQGPFPRPAGLEPDIAFWTRVYTEVGTDGGLIHDAEHLSVVYEVLQFEEGISRRERIREVKRVKKRYQDILRRLAGGERTGLSAEEQRVLALWPEDVSARTLRRAARELRFQLGQADKFREGLIRSGAWMAHIRQILAERGLPPELAALPHVESSFNPDAYSKAGAAGLWQFTRSTGRRFMRIDHVVDERMDPFESTIAAARLLEHNYATLGSWPLAITAYNHGVAGMRRALRKFSPDDIEGLLRGYDSRRFGFASRNFYVAFLAAVDVDAHAAHYFGELERHPERDSAVITVPDYISAQSISAALGVHRAALRDQNPALLHPVWSGNKHVPKGFGLRLPRELAGEDPAALLASISDEDRHARQKPDVYHRIRRGETLSRIAREYGFSITELAELNGLRSRHRIRAGQVLRLPVTDGSALALARAPGGDIEPEPLPEDGIYVVRRGDRLAAIARRFDLDERELAEANGLHNRHRIYAGQTLRIALAPEQEPEPAVEPEALAVAVAEPEVDASAVETEPPSAAIALAEESSGRDLLGAQAESGELLAAWVDPAPPPLLADAPEAVLPAAAGSPAPAAADDAVNGTELGETLEAQEHFDAREDHVLGNDQPDLAADPSDYSVAEDGTIEVQATETLGHYSHWLELRTQRLRDINRLRFETPVMLGRRLELDFSRVDPATFEARRQAYHRALQEEFFAQYRIKDAQTHIIAAGESVWVLAHRRYQVPVWLLRQYNPDLELDRLRPGTAVRFPRLEANLSESEPQSPQTGPASG